MFKVTIVLAVGLAFLAIRAAGQPVNGRNVTFVSYGPGDRELGVFLQRRGFTWREVNEGGNSHFDFDETGRDDWSVYLRDSSRNVSVQLDLYLKKIFFTDESGKRRELYAVRDASSKMNGWLVSRAGYSDGSGRIIGEFDSRTPGLWVERSLPEGEVKFRFKELNRDDWSVYLEDRSRNVAIQIDLYTRKVMYNQIGESDRRQIYRVEAAE